MIPPQRFSDRQILELRPPKNAVDESKPYAFLVEQEYSAVGELEDVATLFLSNRECPFRCLMCDLWKNTSDEMVSAGSIPKQIDYALERLPQADSIKLYNSGNFFDAKAISPSDHDAISQRCHGFRTVIVENHPRLTDDRCLQFRDRVESRMEVAMGLETTHPEILPLLNKQMTVDDFSRATEFLTSHDIAVRAFILLRPPHLTEDEGVDWAIKSANSAFDMGVTCCSIIPTRPGNGILDSMLDDGSFQRPTIRSMERVIDELLPCSHGRVFMDLWDVEQFYQCPDCGPQRRDRLQHMNLTQGKTPQVRCKCDP
ncbi:MAG: radical SAM protein [Planctomycetaceae bacterium]|nr:radical SAM protein [Planctomycetaceae bacterium]